MTAEPTCPTCDDYTTTPCHYADGTPYTFRGCDDPERWGFAPILHWPCWHSEPEPRQLAMFGAEA